LYLTLQNNNLYKIYIDGSNPGSNTNLINIELAGI
jgi:hypothetical protein